MALNLSPEKGVKLTKKDRGHVLEKMKQGWKATCLYRTMYLMKTETFK